MALGYRTVLTTDATPDNRDAVLEILRGWITKKKKFPSLPTAGAVTNDAGSTLTAARFSNETSSGYRWELAEEWDLPRRENVQHSTKRAVMHVTLVLASGKLWFWVDVEPPTLTFLDQTGRTRQETQYTGTPAFVSQVLDAVEMQDGRAEPMSGFQEIPKASYVDYLVAVVEDDERLGAVFVTSPPHGSSLKNWTVKSNDRAYAMQGLGIGYVLAAEALTEFNRRAAFGHSVPPGGMRTFLPGARLGEPEDAFNHKLMHPSTLRDSDERRVRRILRSAQIQRLGDIRLPDVLRDADYEFLRLRRLQPFEVLHEVREAEGLTSTVAMAEEAADLRRRLADAEHMALEAVEDNRALQKERDDARDEAELERLEAQDYYARYSVGRRALEKLESRVDYLRTELSERGGGAAAWAAEDAEFEEYPATFAELLQRVDAFSGVRFTGDRNATNELDEHTVLGEAIVMKAWDALLTFDAYAQARRAGKFDHSLSQYVKFSDHGCLVRIGKVVWTESESVKNNEKYRAQRVLPVDLAVDSSGLKLMVAHVKLSNLTGVAPRLYFDDTYSAVGYVTVGYLGSHMDNTHTN